MLFGSTKKYKKYGSIFMHIYRDRTKLIIAAETLSVKRFVYPLLGGTIRQEKQSLDITFE